MYCNVDNQMGFGLRASWSLSHIYTIHHYLIKFSNFVKMPMYASFMITSVEIAVELQIFDNRNTGRLSFLPLLFESRLWSLGFLSDLSYSFQNNYWKKAVCWRRSIYINWASSISWRTLRYTRIKVHTVC